MPLNLVRTRQRLQDFDFHRLFVEELGWNNPPHALKPADAEAKGGLRFRRTPAAVLSGIHVFEIVVADGLVPDAKSRAAIHTAVSILAAENLLIFTDAARTQSLWYWVKREAGKSRPRDHLYIKGQPGDLFLSKLAALVVDISELDAKGNIPLTEVARRLKDALDVERVTKAFFRDFQEQHLDFISHIEGIPDARERRWYASVLLNRLMFVWFLQKKGFLDVGKKSVGDHDYLARQFAAATAGPGKKDRFFSHFLRDLFFEGFAKPVKDRTPVGSLALGDIPYLNGGLFLPHGIESRIEGGALATGPYKKIKIADVAFAGLFKLFAGYSWSLNDTPGGNDKEINPDVLGYIFEKYINQKEFGAYYTRPEITEYLCEQTIHQLALDAATKWTATATQLHTAGVTKGQAPRVYGSIGDLLLHADGQLCQHLLQEVLPRLSLLDPACGSGAFLVAALKTLLNLSTGLIGRCQALGHRPVLQWLEHEQKKHRAPQAYWLKKKFITENLYGVDLMEEAVEIAKLRLFLTLVASAEARDQLEPLPNIEFNLLPGNSLIGLLHVDPAGFDSGKSTKGEQMRSVLTHETELGLTIESTTAPTTKETVAAYLAKERASKYAGLLREKNRLVALYRKSTSITQDLAVLRAEIEAQNAAARDVLDRQLLNEFHGLGIQFSQATWDAKKQAAGKSEKRPLILDDIRALHPFHWAYEFDEIIVNRGGFDAIITNPPWEVFETSEKQFSIRYESTIQKNSISIEEWTKMFADFMKQKEFREAWLEYASGFPHVSEFFKNSIQFRNQVSVIDGRQAASKINLFKNFTEQCFNLLRTDGRCGTVIPSSIYTDRGATQLRRLLFAATRVSGLFCFENREKLFEGVDSRFKFVVLSFEKGGSTERFPARFMRHDVGELADFPDDDALDLRVDTITRLSPDTLSLMEFTSAEEIEVAEKMLRHPMLGERRSAGWNLALTQEFNITADSELFETVSSKRRLPLLAGKMFHQFTLTDEPAIYWIDEAKGRRALLGSEPDTKQELDYQKYRWVFRRIARNTDSRTFITSIAPRGMFTEVNSPTLSIAESGISLDEMLFLCAVANSFVLEWMLRLKVTSTLNFFYIEQLPLPRLTATDLGFRPLVERAARLVGTTPEYDELLKEIFGPRATHRTHGEHTVDGRARLRAEIDAQVAYLYALTESEFTHILGTFPLVAEPVKAAALSAYRAAKQFPIQAGL